MRGAALARTAVICLVPVAVLSLGAIWAHATGKASVRHVPIEELRSTIASLRGFEPPTRELDEYIVDKLAAQQLGKALFWDVQVGSDGNACASCHFHAGADIRVKNQVSPGLKAGDTAFDPRPRGRGLSGPNKDLSAADFPFHRLDNPNDRESRVVFDTNDVFSSQGTFGGDFVAIKRDAPPKPIQPVAYDSLPTTPQPKPEPPGFNETCRVPYDPAGNSFHSNNLVHRKVEPRQTPTTINAVFNIRQFWDGRANTQFNGVDPFGARAFQPRVGVDGPGNPDARKTGTLVAETAGAGGLRLEQRLINNASLASQAVGPPLSDFEMSCANKTFADLGRKLIPLRALAQQAVHGQDSLLAKSPGLIAHLPAKGLNTTYRALIEKAFNAKFWAAGGKVRVTETGTVVADDSGFTQMEHNFSLFWGLAIQEYEALLISDDSPFDRAMNGDISAMSDQARVGQLLFLDKAECSGCHFGPLMSGATAVKSNVAMPKVVEHMPLASGHLALYDTGYYNIGVRPTIEDLGVGAKDPYGFDLSYVRQYKWQLLGQAPKSADWFEPNPCKWVVQFYPCDNVPTATEPRASHRDAVDGSFKVPILRNVGLNPPYFHNGGQATLKDVVRFYNRGGDRRGPLGKDSSHLPTPTPFGQVNATNLAPDIGDASNILQNHSLGLTEREMDALVQFLLSLSDDRVACHSDVFDHPELPLSLGHSAVARTGSQIANDIMQVLPAVGRGGLKGVGKPCFPNSGDLFGTVNTADPRPLQATFSQILDPFQAPARRDPVGGPTTVPGRRLPLGPTGPVAPQPPQLPPGQPLPVAFGNIGVAVPQPAPVPSPVYSTSLDKISAFTAIGFLQHATVSGDACSNLPPKQWGGTALINNQTIVIPCNTILQMPAATFTWADLFDPDVVKPLTLPASGATFGNGTFRFPSVEVRIEGNNVAGQFIAGLVYISQQSLNTGTGIITGFDYEQGVIFVGSSNGQAARLQINDPVGRFSVGRSPDHRFSVDSENPTIRATTGYPMCIPRQDPSKGDDARCPQRNRPRVEIGCRSFAQANIQLPTGLVLARPTANAAYCTGFVMKAPPGTPVTPALPDIFIASANEPDAREQAPFQVGDLVTYSGTLLQGDGAGPGGADTISVHTITANVGIYTQPGTLPAYLAIGEFRVGTFAPVVTFNGVPQEEQDRIVLEASTTDVTSIVDVYLVDIDPSSGVESQRWVTPGVMTGGIGAAGSNGRNIDGGITTQFVGPQPGRVRLAAGKAVPGILKSPTRYARVVMRSLCDPANINGLVAPFGKPTATPVDCLKRAPAANGLFSGQYLAPNYDFIFPETLIPGDPIVPNNFWEMGFLVNGEGPGTGQLKPRPW